MSFDATKLAVGEWYRRRDGGRARFLGGLKHEKSPLVFAVEFDGSEGIGCYLPTGRYMESREHCYDIISSDPIRDPVKIAVPKRFLSVHKDGDWFLYETRGQLDSTVTSLRLATYELPAEIEVTPTN
jgi:hypothetical protein